MRNFLQKYPLHTFLLTFFLSVFLFAQNAELVQLHMMQRTLIIGSLFTIVLFFLVFLIIKEKIKAGIITTLIFLSLFNYGILYDGLENMYYSGLWPFQNIHRYAIVLILLYIICIVWFINKKIIIGEQINFFLNGLILILIVFNSSKILYHITKTSQKSSSLIVSLNDTEQSSNPNIYYIVLDGYANEHVLKKYYQFDNASFINFLKNKDFYNADSAFSNYYSTSPSLSATLNMDYHSDGDSANYFEKLRNNKVFSILKTYGYKTFRMQSGYAVTSGLENIDSVITINAPNEFERSILKYSICRLDELFGFLPFYRLKSQINNLNSTVDIKSTQPKFMFIHIVAPHPPYVFNENGERSFGIKDGDNSWEPKSHYVAQLKYINKITQKFLNYLVLKDPEAVVILQSDHGSWISSKSADEVFEARSMILNTIRFGNIRSFKYLNTKLSSVNTFRSVFKTILDSNLTLLPDSQAGKYNLTRSVVFINRIIR